MRTKQWGAFVFAGALLAAGLGSARADDAAAADAYNDAPYFAAQYAKEFPDHVRRSSTGNGYQLTFGLPLSFLSHVPSFVPPSFVPNTSLELSFYDVSRRRDIDGSKDYQTTLFFNLAHDFGLYAFDGKYTHYLPKFRPFVLAGPGLVHDDASGKAGYHFGIDAGGGLLFPLPWWGMQVRTEAIAQMQANHVNVPGQNVLTDYRLMLGLQIPLTPLFETVHHMVSKGSECSVAVVGVSNGRSDCNTDSDGDGVPDDRDQCPDTPRGTPVDAVGCPLKVGNDSDGDGVPDAQDLCPNTPKGAKVDANGCAVDQTMTLPDVQFELDSAKLTEASQGVLDNVARGLNGQPNLHVQIGGYTDATGKSDYNLKLSDSRAEAVRQYLIGKGVAADRLTTKGYGESEPKASNDTAEGRETNRRVEFKLSH